ncbi:MAG: nitroreductase [Pseudomonadota bacterium]|nr:nitroreductase [Pseudomonadota bacterium]
MDVLEAIKKRHSVRAFLDKEVDESVVREIIEVSKQSPSGVNSQPWKVYAVLGKARDNLVKEACEKFDAGSWESEEYQVYPNKENMPDWYKARQRACGFGMYGVLGIEREDREKRTAQARKNYELFGAPVGLFVSVNKAVGPNGWGHVGHFVQSICLAAVGSGLGTCLQEAWAGFPSLLKKHLDHGDDEIIWCGISMGYEDKNEVINSFVPDREKFDSFAKIIK